MLEVLDVAIREAALKQEEVQTGQGSLFGMPGDDSDGDGAAHVRTLPNVAPLSESERLAKEKEILGFYISGHPLEPYRMDCELYATHKVAQLGTWTEEQMTLGVVVTAIKRQISRRSGSEYARLVVEDFSGSSEILVFPEAWLLLGERIKQDIPLLIRGRYSRRDRDAEKATFTLDSVSRFEEIRASGQVSVSIELRQGAPLNQSVLQDVRTVAEAHHGSTPIELRWSDGKGANARLRSRTLKLAATHAALSELRALLGNDQFASCVRRVVGTA
jgi:DNA polymerase-3 subunit alpha